MEVYQKLFKEVQHLEDARYIFLQIELHQDRAITSERQNLERLGFQVVSISHGSRSIGIARISRARFYGLEQRLMKYAQTRTHKGKSYFAPIEAIRKVPAEERIPLALADTRDIRSDYLISMHEVLPRPDELATIIQEVVPTLVADARVFNISLGQGPIVTRQFSRIAALLDHLARNFGVLFIVSAGNITPEAVPPAHFLPESARTKSPGEALLALTVGSIAKTTDAKCVACVQGVSPFSCRGPGADDGYKPEIVAHGGNASFDGANWKTSFQVGVLGISQDGQSLAFSCGTSYSAPLVAQYAARLFDAYSDISANMVRGLLCHFTEPAIAPASFPHPPSMSHGFGEPSMERALFALGSTVAYLYEGTITAGQYQFIPFLIPQAFAARQQHLVIRVTLAFDPPVDVGNSAEYSQTRLVCCLRKRLRVGMREIPVGGSESDHRIPWNPIIQFTKDFRRSFAAGQWELKIRLMTRGSLPSNFAQSYAAIIEVVDATGQHDVREDILREMGGQFVPISLQLAA